MAEIEVPESGVGQPGVGGRLPEVSEMRLVDQAPDPAGEEVAGLRKRPFGPPRSLPAWKSHQDNILKH